MSAGRPRTPLQKAKATGAVKHDPQRYRDRKEPDSRPLGKPSRNLSKAECEMWEALKREMWWLCEADRMLVELAVKLRAKNFTKAGLDLNESAQLLRIAKTLGGSPTDRSRVLVNPNSSDGAADPADEFLQ